MKKRGTLTKRLVKAGFFATERNEAFIRAELDRLARQVRNIRKEVLNASCGIDAGYKTALTDVLALIREARK